MINFKDDYLDENFIASFNDNNTDCLTEIGKNIFYGKILSDIFCDLVMEKIKSHELNEGQKLTQNANSMHDNAILIEDLGLKELIDEFCKKFLMKLIYLKFPVCMNYEFNSIHSYVVRYGSKMDSSLDFHVDDSLVTMNLCLNEGFTGSDLIFNGIRCPMHIDTPYEDNEKIIIRHKKGLSVIHDGKNRHFVNPIQSGNRYGLIIWCQSSKEKSDWFNALENWKCTKFCDFKK